MTSSSSTNASSDIPSVADRRPTLSKYRRRHFQLGSRAQGRLATIGACLCTIAAAGAPLAVGTVHRPTLVILEVMTLVGIALLFGVAVLRRQTLRTGPAVVLPLLFLVIPCLQSVPLPFGIHRIVDPRGSAILAAGLLGPRPTMPLSLDPPATRVRIGEAAAGLAIFIAAFHLASGQRRRHLMLRGLGIAGIAAVVIGVGHGLFGLNRIYGLYTTTKRTIFIGPFVNPNHSAEFLNLAAFVCLACAFQRPTMLNRVGWLVATCLCFGGSIATLSRGGAVALGAAGLTFFLLRYLSPDQERAGPSGRRVSLAWGSALAGVVILAAVAFGASDLISRFQTDHINQDLRLRVWRDSLQVIRAHPFGIGRGAFDRVYPIYRTIRTNFALRFAFVENEPLQMLIDCGWLLFVGCVAAFGWVSWNVVRGGRRDRIEAALLAGLVGVLVHNGVDFGLEIPGVLWPFAAVLGTTLGRLHSPEATEARWRGWPLLSVTCAALTFGVAAVAHASYDDFDFLLRQPANSKNASLVERAERTHPTDYYYALAEARLVPLRSVGGPSPRLHALNRALALCPSCEQVHAEVARNLWVLGLRRQSLQEWRTVVALQPASLRSTLGELHAGGARPTDLASIVTFDPIRLTEVADYLASLSRPDQALIVLDQAEALGVPPADLYLLRAKLQLQQGDSTSAAATVDKARAARLRDPRLDVLEAKLLLADQGSTGVDQALSILDQAAARFPEDAEVQRARLAIVMTYQKWAAASRAIEGLKRALFVAGGSAGEAHIAAARLDSRLSRWTNALDEYRIALADSPNDVSLWIEFGRAASSAGRNATAREAFVTADHLSPNSPEIVKAIQDLDGQAQSARAGTPTRPTLR